MDARTLARGQAVGRIGIGALMTVAPRLVATIWLGRNGARAASRVPVAAQGARDLAIGVGVVTALESGGVRPWLLAGAFADVVDMLATLRHRSDLPGPPTAAVVPLAAASAALAVWLQRELG